MDQRAHAVEADLKNILNTRLALAHKLQLLEKQVEDTVRGTKAATRATLDLAKNKTVKLIEAVTYNLNPPVLAGKRPWIMVGGAVAVGFVASLMEQRRRASGVYPYYPPKAKGAKVMPSAGRGRANVPSGVYPFYSAEEQHPARTSEWPRGSSNRVEDRRRSTERVSHVWRSWFSLWDELTDDLTQQRMRLQRAVIHAGRSFIRDLTHIAGQILLDQLNRPSSTSHRRWSPRNDE
jgi:hypothetical protein